MEIIEEGSPLRTSFAFTCSFGLVWQNIDGHIVVWCTVHQSELKPQVHAQNSQQTSERTKRTAENIVMNSKEGVIMKRRMCARSTTESKRQRENEHELNKAHTHTHKWKTKWKERTKEKTENIFRFCASVPFIAMCASIAVCVCAASWLRRVVFTEEIRNSHSISLFALSSSPRCSRSSEQPVRDSNSHFVPGQLTALRTHARFAWFSMCGM